MSKFDLNRIAAIAGIVGAVAAVIALWPIFFPHSELPAATRAPTPQPSPQPVPPPQIPDFLAGTKWGICIAEHGCPWPSNPGFETRGVGCGNPDEEAKKLCAYDDGTERII